MGDFSVCNVKALVVSETPSSNYLLTLKIHRKYHLNSSFSAPVRLLITLIHRTWFFLPFIPHSFSLLCLVSCQIVINCVWCWCATQNSAYLNPAHHNSAQISSLELCSGLLCRPCPPASTCSSEPEPDPAKPSFHRNLSDYSASAILQI